MNKAQRKIAKELLRLAYEAKADTELPASIVASQAILETGWLEHIPTDYIDRKVSYNILGIKAIPGKYEGSNGYVTTGTYEWDSINKWYYSVKRAAFRAYNNYEECFRDYGVIIWNSKVNLKVFGIKTPIKVRRYRHALTKKALTDPRKYLREIHKAGYATDPKYYDKVIAIAESCGYIRKEEEND